MSTTNKSIVFLVLTFAFSWTFAIGGWALGMQRSPLGVTGALFAMMTGPALAALICAVLFEKGRRIDALGLRFRLNIWWLAALLVPFALAAVALGVTLLSGRHLVDPGEAAYAAAAPNLNGPKLAQLSMLRPLLDPIIVVQAAIGIAINAVVLTFTEELGWRGYLHHLWRPSGFWRTSLATGVIWGAWHAPAIYLYGLNYPQNREIGIPIFIVFCTLLAPVMTFIRDRASATWATGITHGAINALGGLTILCVSNPTFPWNGIVGVGGFVALALGLAAVAAAQPGLAPKAAAA